MPGNSNFHFSPPLLCSVAAFDPELVTFCSLLQDHRGDAWVGPDARGSQAPRCRAPGVRVSDPTREGVVRGPETSPVC